MSEKPLDDAPGALALDVASLALAFTSLAVFGAGSETGRSWLFGLSVGVMALATTLKLISTRKRQRVGAHHTGSGGARPAARRRYRPRPNSRRV